MIEKFYDSFEVWGKEQSVADKERIDKTRALVPGDVKSILDVGCGDGNVTNDLIKKGLAITGIDISEMALKHFKGEKVTASIGSMPFAKNSFDLVLCAEVLEHIPNDAYQNALSEIERVAKKYIIISTPYNELLESSQIRCDKCGSVFNRNMHLRSFNEDVHKELFSSKFKRSKTIFISQNRFFPKLTKIDHHIANYYQFRSGVYCTFCNSMIEKQKPNTAQRIMLKMTNILRKVSPKPYQARWICSLYEISS